MNDLNKDFFYYSLVVTPQKNIAFSKWVINNCGLIFSFIFFSNDEVLEDKLLKAAFTNILS